MASCKKESKSFIEFHLAVSEELWIKSGNEQIPLSLYISGLKKEWTPRSLYTFSFSSGGHKNCNKLGYILVGFKFRIQLLHDKKLCINETLIPAT